MERPTKEQLIGTWESYKLINSKGETMIDKNVSEWTFYKDGLAEIVVINDFKRITDLNQRTWDISEEPDNEGYYSLPIRKEPWNKILFIDNKELILGSKEMQTVFKKLY